jgi:hypothetical protein
MRAEPLRWPGRAGSQRSPARVARFLWVARGATRRRRARRTCSAQRWPLTARRARASNVPRSMIAPRACSTAWRRAVWRARWIPIAAAEFVEVACAVIRARWPRWLLTATAAKWSRVPRPVCAVFARATSTAPMALARTALRLGNAWRARRKPTARPPNKARALSMANVPNVPTTETARAAIATRAKGIVSERSKKSRALPAWSVRAHVTN